MQELSVRDKKKPNLFTQYLAHNKIIISYGVSEKHSFAITSLHNEILTEEKRKSLNKFYEHMINVKNE